MHANVFNSTLSEVAGDSRCRKFGLGEMFPVHECEGLALGIRQSRVILLKGNKV